MLPSVSKLVSDTQKIITNPKLAATKFVSSQGAKAVSRKAVDMVKPVHQRISDFKKRHIVNNDDIATVAAVADILYRDMLKMEINGLRLNRKAPEGYSGSFPVAFLFSEEAVTFADMRLDQKVEHLKHMRTIFKEVIPVLIGSIAFASYIDLKGLASKMTSIVGADINLVKECLKTCENGVQVADKGLKWAGAYDATIDQFLEAHKKT